MKVMRINGYQTHTAAGVDAAEAITTTSAIHYDSALNGQRNPHSGSTAA
jgi:hypothetical protein